MHYLRRFYVCTIFLKQSMISFLSRLRNFNIFFMRQAHKLLIRIEQGSEQFDCPGVNELFVASEPTDLVDLGITGRDFRYTIVFIRRCVVVIYGHRQVSSTTYNEKFMKRNGASSALLNLTLFFGAKLQFCSFLKLYYFEDL